MNGDPVAFGKELAAIVKAATGPLLDRIKELEQRAAVAGPQGEPGEEGAPGKDADPELVKSLVAEAVAALPKPADGEPGAPGREPTVEEVEAAVKAYLIANPPADGAPGRDAAPIEQAQIEKAVADHLARFPIPPGRDGQPGQPGRDGEGKKGADGRDGFSPDDLELTLGDDGRTVTIALKCGDRVVQRSLRLAVPLDQGVFTQGKDYQVGDCVSYGGNMWIAKADTGEAPGTSPAWRLAVRRGRDGGKGAPGAKGEPGRAGKDAGPNFMQGSLSR